MLLLTFIIGCIMLMAAAALGAFYALIRRPPVVHVDLGNVRIDVAGTLDATQAIPSTLNLRWMAIPPESPSWNEQVAPIPTDILEYIDAESDEWARQARRTHARTLFMETADWAWVLATLKREDGVVDEGLTKPDA